MPSSMTSFPRLIGWRLLPWGLLALGLLLTLLLLWGAWQREMHNQRQAFAVQAERVRESVTRHLKAIDASSSTLETLIRSSVRIDGDQFRIFAEDVMAEAPSILRASLLTRVNAEQRREFEHSRQRFGFPTYTITEPRGERLVPADHRPVHFPVSFYEPLDPLTAMLLGVDLGALVDVDEVIRLSGPRGVALLPSPHAPALSIQGQLLHLRPVMARTTRTGFPDTSTAEVNGFIMLELDFRRLLATIPLVGSRAVELWLPRTGLHFIREGDRAGEDSSPVISRLERRFQEGDIGEGCEIILRQDVRFQDLEQGTLAVALGGGLALAALLFLAGRLLTQATVEQHRRHAEISRQVAEKTRELVEGNTKLVQEIRERRQAEKALADSERKYRTLIETANDAILLVDGESGLIIDANERATRLFGLPLNDILGRRQDSLHAPEEGGQAWPLLRAQGLEGAGARQTGIVRPDGSEVPVEISASACQLEGAWIIQGIYRDVSERVESEKRLRQVQKMEAIGTLAGGIAHDFNNILNVIQGYAELGLRESLPGGRGHDFLRQILIATERAAKVVRQMLAFSRRDTQERQAVALPPLLKESLKLLRGMLPSTIEIRTDIALDCPPVHADVNQLQQVIMNICTNAYHAMRQTGGILTVSLRRVTVDAPQAAGITGLHEGDYLRLGFLDTGMGMDSEIAARIFEPYFTTKQVGEGSGLGLAMVHGIVAAHGGAVTVTSEPGHGSCFDVYLPALAALATQPPAADEAPLPRLRGRVLLVDDEPLIVDVSGRLLQQLGCQVEAHTSSLAALEAFRREPDSFAAVLSDQTMPGLTGVQLAQALLAIRPDIPIVLATGYSEAIDEERARDYGIAALLMKPLGMKELARALERWLADR